MEAEAVPWRHGYADIAFEDSSERAAMQDPEGAGTLDVRQATAGNGGPDVPPGRRTTPRRWRENVCGAPGYILGTLATTGVWWRSGGDAVCAGHAGCGRALKI